MSEPEQIATWLERLHCDRWEDEDLGCFKSNCMLFRELAASIRSGEYL